MIYEQDIAFDQLRTKLAAVEKKSDMQFATLSPPTSPNNSRISIKPEPDLTDHREE